MFNKTVLDNGIQVISEEINHVRSVSIGLLVRCGSRYEDDATHGMAHFIEHMLFKGTQNRSAFDIARAIDSIGGVMNAFTGKEFTSFYIKIPDYHLNLAIDLLADIFMNSRFDEEEILKEKSVVIQEIHMLEDTPDDYIHDFFEALFWNGHVLGFPILGTKEQVKTFQKQKLLRFFETNYKKQSLLVAAAGRLNHHILVDLVSRAFNPLCGKVPKVESIPPVISSKVAVIEKDLEQVHMLIGCLAPSAISNQRYAASLLNTITGGASSSKLFQEIRENRGLAYIVHSYLIPYMDVGMFGIYVGTSKNKVQEVIRLTFEIMKGLCKEPPGEKEIHTAKELLKGNFLLSMENTDNRMTKLAKNEICFGRQLSVEEIIAEIESVTPEDICSLAQDTFIPGVISLAAIGNISEKDINLHSLWK
jgi:predicted Zn-dependent peptidase